MTAPGSPTRQQRADAMRARILAHPEAWLTLCRPRYRRLDPAEFQDTDDKRGLLLHQRDPRALEMEYEQCRARFRLSHDPGEIRWQARRAVQLNRHLSARENAYLERLERAALAIEVQA